MGKPFTYGEIRILLGHFKMSRLQNGFKIFGGCGDDYNYRLCRLKDDDDNEVLDEDEAEAIATGLLFVNSNEMRCYLEKIS